MCTDLTYNYAVARSIIRPTVSHAFALAVMFLNQITGLEAELRGVRTELSKCRAEEPREDGGG